MISSFSLKDSVGSYVVFTGSQGTFELTELSNSIIAFLKSSLLLEFALTGTLYVTGALCDT